METIIFLLAVLRVLFLPYGIRDDRRGGEFMEQKYVFCLSRIKEHYKHLSKMERQIADYFLEHYSELKDFSANELAEKTETSPATVIRFCKAIGFKGLLDFKNYINNSFAASNSERVNLYEDDSTTAIKNKIFRFNRISIEDTLAVLDDEELEKVAKLINDASLIAIVSEGGSGCAARSAFDSFLQIGLPCTFLEDPMFQVMGVARLPKDGVVLAVCHSGRARNTCDAVKVANERGIKTIGLVGITGSPILEYLDHVLMTGVAEHPYFSNSIAARICELHVISSIHAIVSVMRKEKLNIYQHEITELLRRKRL